MGSPFARPRLVGNINQAFHADRIEATVAQVGALGAEADAFDIAHALGLLGLQTEAELKAYRDDLAVPALNKAILALAFRTAVERKIPLSFAIASGHAESVQVTASDTLISVVLTRVD